MSGSGRIATQAKTDTDSDPCSRQGVSLVSLFEALQKCSV